MVSQRTQWWGVCVVLLLLVPFFALPAQTVGWEWLNPKPTGNSMYDVQMITEQFGVAVGENGGTIMTYDAGRTWVVRSVGTNLQLHAVHFRDSLNGVAAGLGLPILQTDDAGITWKIRKQGEATGEQLEAIRMLTPQVGVALGGATQLAESIEQRMGG